MHLENRNPATPARARGDKVDDVGSINRCDDSAPIGWGQVCWLVDQGMPRDFVPAVAQLRVVGDAIAFYEETSDDVILWRPRSGTLSSMEGRAFALGEDAIGNAATYAFDTFLAVHAEPMDWLRDRGRGIVVLRWDLAFDMLRHAPRVAVEEAVLPLYRHHMLPPHVPELSVIERRQAA
jgi:hypothetical protein